jgi:flagellar biosynthetic protein FliQ
MTDHSLGLVVRGLGLALRLGIPAIAGATVGSIIAGFIQSLTSWNDGAVSYVPKVIAVTAAYAIAAPWISEEILSFARVAWGTSPRPGSCSRAGWRRCSARGCRPPRT